ncbi:MAG: 23S rRNA (pseudouridine(1915)-N(3))-methyltransferase RlmH [Actinomycetia bacterium]|nr:23S rRNA (pseudouridine(1915)-N(3))-methyltransferase RlmH [Actinomycetes bacterium]
MVKITIIAVGKLTEAFWREAADEYIKRLRPYTQLEVIEVADAPDSLGVEQALDREAVAILKALPVDAFVLLLDSKGKVLTSEQRAQWLERLMVEGTSHIACIIGGSNGVSDAIHTTAQQSISFGPITLPHNLARIVLLEQLYRSFKIMRNEPYHK